MHPEDYYDRQLIASAYQSQVLKDGFKDVAASITTGHRYTIVGAEDFAMLAFVIGLALAVGCSFLAFAWQRVTEALGRIEKAVVERCNHCKPSFLLDREDGK